MEDVVPIGLKFDRRRSIEGGARGEGLASCFNDCVNDARPFFL
jgi:hypothetical protein